MGDRLAEHGEMRRFPAGGADSAKQVPERLVAEAGAANDASQGLWIKPLGARNCYQPLAVAQHDVFALPDYLIVITFSLRFDSGRAARYSRIASRMFSIASFSVAPWLWQPGKLGQETSWPYLLL